MVEGILQHVHKLDVWMLMAINHSHTPFMDSLMTTLTSGFLWIPLYMSLLFMVIRNNETMFQIMLIVGFAIVCVLTSSVVTNALVKPYIGRLRPINDPLINTGLHLVRGMHSDAYSFFSAHASNTFSIALFFSLIVRDKLLTFSLIVWSLVNCYTRMYLGMHYPSDIIVGLLWGSLVGFGVYHLYQWINDRCVDQGSFVSSAYTVTGYRQREIHLVLSTLTLCLLYGVLTSIYKV